MNKAELESKHLSELHTLAAEAGVERYRMLPRAELIDALADGSSGGGGGGGDRGGREPRQQGGGQRQSRGGRGGRDSGGGGRGGRQRQSRGGGREGGGDRQPRGGGREGGGGRDRSRRRPEGEKREPEASAQPAPQPPRSEDSGERPKRKRRRRRFGRRGGKTVRPHEMLLPAAGARQALVYAETREGCTALLRELAADLSGSGKGPDPVALLVDPSPEELAEWKREAPKAEIVSAGQERHAEDALASAVRRAESGEAVVLLIDSLSRVAEEFGGSKAAKELFDGGLVAGGSGAGSLTVVAAVERAAD